MFKSIRARISAAWAAFFTMTIIALAVFAPAQHAEARGFSSGGYSGSYSRAYVSRAYVAPRIYASPRVAVVVRPRPLVVVRPYYRPPVVIMPMVQPQTVVEADGTATQPVAVVESSDTEVFLKTLWIGLLIGAVIALFGGVYYGYGYYGNVIVDSFDIFTDALIIDEISCGGDFL